MPMLLARATLSPQERAVHARLDRLDERGVLELLRQIARDHHVAVEDVVGVRRHKAVVAARHAVWNALHDGGMSWPEIEALWGARPGCVIQARKKRRASDQATANIAAWVDGLADVIRGSLEAKMVPPDVAAAQIATLEHVRAGVLRGEWCKRR